MAEEQTHAGNLKLIGGALCLDFANTVDSHAGSDPLEWLSGYDDLIAWSQHRDIVTGDEARRLLRGAARQPSTAQRAYQRAITLRETLFRIFLAVADGEDPRADDLATLNAMLADALTALRVARGAEGFAWGWEADEDALDRILWPILWSAAQLLVSGQLDRVKRCANPTCGWVFLDTSRNRSRRWCTMEDCGNRAKARKFYRRKRAER